MCVVAKLLFFYRDIEQRGVVYIPQNRASMSLIQELLAEQVHTLEVGRHLSFPEILFYLHRCPIFQIPVFVWYT
jgi:hypothetical protein